MPTTTSPGAESPTTWAGSPAFAVEMGGWRLRQDIYEFSGNCLFVGFEGAVF
jgi:hypothetical protein